jgi:hypothetical protein
LALALFDEADLLPLYALSLLSSLASLAPTNIKTKIIIKKINLATRYLSFPIQQNYQIKA